MKKTKLALLHSVIALLLCCSMLIGTTFAWFTDSVTSGVNHIIAGNLDVELEYLDENDKWQPVREGTNVFAEGTLWEPGHTEVVYLKVSNLGTLALKYNLGVNIVSETGSINKDGDPFLLSDHIEFGVVQDVSSRFGSREEARKAVTGSKLISEGYSKSGSIAKDGAAQYVALVVYMPEETDNVANYMTGENPPKIDLGINLVATQMTAEGDSFGSDYDTGAAFPKQDINVSVGQSVGSKIENSKLTEQVTVGNVDNDIYAVVPDGVQMADGATSLQLSVSAKEESEATITLDDGEVALPLDIHMEGVSENNTTPMLVTLKGLLRKGLNSTSVAMYHVENGVTVAMTLVALSDLDAHNEFSYDPATGDVTLCVASFSEYVPVVNNDNPWEGKTEAYKGSGTESDPYLIMNANQLAQFGLDVDNGKTFEGEFVKLGAEIVLSGLDTENNRVSFNPIGCGYEDESINSKDENGNPVPGRVFKGTFDGQNYTISGLYQNGWDLGLSYCNLGGGLFASVADATIQNLTISGAEIAMECVEMGVVAGLSQGVCTYENINIYGCKIANYQKATGGVVGEVSPYNGESTHTFKNINIDPTTVVGSLWGDFDAPVGGVIGAKWDDTDTTKVVMENVNVACRLDVYNDVTSAYEWYAYRRAGMLIGNTEETTTDANGTTVASTVYADGTNYLVCTNVVVIYDDWANYHYCQFTNQKDTWCNNYPWVRVEVGENCSAYSNPRYGQPVLTDDTKIVDSQHTHSGSDEHMVQLTFNQLYGGGQGVYGGNAHISNGVTIGKYTITYMDHGEILYVEYIIDNANIYTNIWPISNLPVNEDGDSALHWVDANNNEFTQVSAGNTADIVVYPKWPDEFAVRCIDTKGNVVYYEFFKEGDDCTTIAQEVNNTLATIQNEVDSTGNVIVVKWDDGTETLLTTVTADYLAQKGADVILTATPELQEGSIRLEKIYDEATGELVAYAVSSVVADDGNINVVIPEYVGTIPVTTISDDAAAGFDKLHVVTIPVTVTTIGSGSFSNANKNGSGETITIYYEGSYEQWKDINKLSGWDDGLGAGTRVFFLNGADTVDTTVYLERYATKNIFGLYYEYDWKEHTTFTSTLKAEYTGECDCGCGTRPDAHYWEGVTVS